MTRAQAQCSNLDSWMLRRIVYSGATTDDWRHAAYLELWTRSTIADVVDENNGPWPTAAVLGRQ